jgi:type VI protein secretion system component Hcp
MRYVLILLFVLPLFSLAQNAKVYIKLTDGGGKMIRGTSTARGYEYWIEALTTGSAGENNIQFLFSMPVSGASALLKSMMSRGEQVLNGEVVVTTVGNNGTLLLSQTIKMEQASVLSCSETMGCNNVMTTAVTLQATRIGWTYYSIDRTGAMVTVSQKFGWDASTRSPWTKF